MAHPNEDSLTYQHGDRVHLIATAIGEAAQEDAVYRLVRCDLDGNLRVTIGDGPSLDAFNRLRTSTPHTLFDSKQLHDALPLFWDDAETSGSGTTSVHDPDAASSAMTVAVTEAGTRVRQTFMRFNYQPGKSQQIFLTGIFGAAAAGITQRLGWFDDENGVFFSLEETTPTITLRSKASGSVVDDDKEQATEWNIDAMDGSGRSKINLDFTKSQIFVIDAEWLGSGRVRCGFFIGGVIVYCHEFDNSNALTEVFMSTPNLPARYEIDNDGTGPATTLTAQCTTVISEGGQQKTGVLRYASTDGAHVDANVADTVYAVVGIRLKSTHLDAVVDLVKITMLNEQSQDFEWKLILNPTVAGTFTYGDVTNSAIQVARGATANTITAGSGVDTDGGWSKASNQAGIVEEDLQNAIKLGSKIDGTRDTWVLAVRPVGTNADIQGSISWRQLS